MFRRFIAKFSPASQRGERAGRVSILIPFLIISAGLGVLAWRSYELSIRMERGANTLAVQYAGYASDITARRIDAAIRSELSRATDEWQQIERRSESPTFSTLREWIDRNPWIITAIYVPDHDPASSVFASEIGGGPEHNPQYTREFFTSSGTVRYTFDPDRLLAGVRGAVRLQPLGRPSESRDVLDIQKQAAVSVVRNNRSEGLVRLSDGFAFFAPLAEPFTPYAVRASVKTAYVGSGWENQRVISLWVSLLALGLMAIGAILAIRGLNKESETMELRGALIANVSHELRTPLSMIRLGAETLKRGARLSEKERLDIQDQILREVLHLSHLVENVLDIARIHNRSSKALAFTPVLPLDLVTTLINTYESWIHSKGFDITMSIEDGLEPQMWDRDAVSRALLNLVDNAIKYSAEDRSIEVAVRQTAADVIIEVRDRGVGIDQGDLEKIFDPYFRAKFSDTTTRRGAGLGLTLVQQIVKSHGGRVEVESQAGSGSTFRLVFPRPSAEEKVALAGVLQQSKPVHS